MKQNHVFWLYLLILPAAFIGSVATASAENTESAQQGILYKAERLLGLEVQNPEGEVVGTLEDLAIDWQAGRAAYAILSYGGYFGGVLDIEDKQFAVPAKALQWASDGEALVLDVDEETIKQAKGFDKYDWPDMEDRDWGTELHRQYGQIAYWEEVAPADEQGSMVDRATAAYLHAQSTGSLQKASDLMDMEVKDNHGQTVGEIEALAIDWQANAGAYALVPFGGFLGIGEKQPWIPLSAMTLVARDASVPLRFSDDNYWRLQVSKAELSQGKAFDKKR